MLVWVVSLSAKKLIPPSLTAKDHVFGIRSLIGFGKLVGPLVHPVLYRQCQPPEAIPKDISRRTGYHEV